MREKNCRGQSTPPWRVLLREDPNSGFYSREEARKIWQNDCWQNHGQQNDWGKLKCFIILPASVLFNYRLHGLTRIDAGTGAFALRMGQGKNKNSASKLDRFMLFFLPIPACWDHPCPSVVSFPSSRAALVRC